MQAALFDTTAASRWEPIPLPGASVWLRRSLLSERAATALLDQLIADVPWRRDTIRMFGRHLPLPRLQQWYGEPGRVYVWSGIEMQPLAWTPVLVEVRDVVQRATKREFDSVLLNYYRDGNDSVGWHADDEPELGPSPFIASLSVGAERDFVLREKDGPQRRASILLEHGSLLVMTGDTQANWQHAVPRRKRVCGSRVNLTFRAFA